MAEPITHHARVIGFDGWVLRTAPRELLRDGKRVRLQDQPLRILQALLENPDRLVTREQLIARLWPTGVVDFDGGLNTAVRKLRAALGDAPEAPRYIETVPRQGYRFIGGLDAAPPSVPTSPSPASANLQPEAPARRAAAHFVPLTAVTAAAVAIGIALLIVASDWRSATAPQVAASAPDFPPSSNADAYALYLEAKIDAQGIAGRASAEQIGHVESLLDQAIALDSTFAAARLERARIRLRKFESSYDVGEENLRALREDLDGARTVAGRSSALLVATEARYAHVVDRDLDRAVRLIEVPVTAASKDVAVLQERAAILAAARRVDESLALYREAARLDPRNRGLFQGRHALLWNARRPAEAMELMREFGVGPSAHVSFVFSFTGNTALLDERVVPVSHSIDAGSRLMARANRLRLQSRSGEAAALLEQSGVETMRHDSFSPLTIAGVGRKPVAELHGWAMLLEGNRAAAAHDGKVLLEFAASEPATRWNAWFLRLLAAEGALFSGNIEEAIAGARAALALAPRGLDPAIDRYAPATAALVLAWAGAADEAVDLLEAATRGYPGLGPAEITRDPLYFVPLAASPRYPPLAARLEAEIAINRQLLAANFF